MSKIKRFAEINGELWEADQPFCAGCPELVVPWHCGYEGNGCRFPESRIEMPRTFRQAFFEAATMNEMSVTEYAESIAKFVAEDLDAFVKPDNG